MIGSRRGSGRKGRQGGAEIAAIMGDMSKFGEATDILRINGKRLLAELFRFVRAAERAEILGLVGPDSNMIGLGCHCTFKGSKCGRAIAAASCEQAKLGERRDVI